MPLNPLEQLPAHEDPWHHICLWCGQPTDEHDSFEFQVSCFCYSFFDAHKVTHSMHFVCRRVYDLMMEKWDLTQRDMLWYMERERGTQFGELQ